MHMKKLMVLCCLFFLMASCNEQPAEKTDLYVYLDYTEGQNYSNIDADFEKYLELMKVSEEHPRNYGTLKIFPLYDVGSTPSSTIKLKEGKSKMEGNKYLRKQEVDKFKAKAIAKVEGMNSEYSGKQLKQSHIFQPLAKGLKKLEKSDADHKIVLIYSDMLENSDLANFHKGIKEEALTNSFDESFPIEDLSDFEFYVIHPIDKKNDQKIQKSGEFWKSFFIKKGLDEDLFHFDTSIEI